MYYLYKITNQLNGKVYIGQTVNDKRRWVAHKSYAKQDEPVQYVHRAMKKYDIENFTYEVIDFAFNQWQADCLEINYIKQYNSRSKKHGYNIAHGGNVTWQSGLPPEAYPMYGKHHTEEHKQYMSDLFKGKRLAPPATEETRQKISNSLMGHLVSEETREKLSDAHMGKILSEEHIQHLSESHIGKVSGMKGKRHTKETRNKISLIQRKFPVETEHEIAKAYGRGVTVKELFSIYNCKERIIYRIISRHKNLSLKDQLRK